MAQAASRFVVGTTSARRTRGWLHRHSQRTVAGPHLGYSASGRAGEVEARDTLPHFTMKRAAESSPRCLRLPWEPRSCAIPWAFSRATMVRPCGTGIARSVVVCHSGVDRTARFAMARHLRPRAAVTRRRE